MPAGSGRNSETPLRPFSSVNPCSNLSLPVYGVFVILLTIQVVRCALLNTRESFRIKDNLHGRKTRGEKPDKYIRLISLRLDFAEEILVWVCPYPLLASRMARVFLRFFFRRRDPFPPFQSRGYPPSPIPDSAKTAQSSGNGLYPGTGRCQSLALFRRKYRM